MAGDKKDNEDSEESAMNLTQKQLTAEVFTILKSQQEAQTSQNEAVLLALARIADALPPRGASMEEDGVLSPQAPSAPTTQQAPSLPSTTPNATADMRASTQHWKALPIPSPLEPEASLRAYEEWRSAWEEYAISADIDWMPLAKQSVHLRRCLSAELKSILTHSLGAPLDSALTLQETLDIIDRHMRGQRNIAVRQQEFNLYRQQQDQSFDAYYARLKQLAKDADLCVHCLDQRLASAIITGLRDRQLAEQLQSHEPALTRDQIVVKCRAHESAKKSNAEMKSPSQTLMKVSTYKKNKHAPVKSTTQHSSSRPKIPDELLRKFSCLRCGNRDKHTNGKCPAADKQCKECSKIGHFNTVCFKKLLKQSGQKSDRNVNTITINNVSKSDSCPTIRARVSCLTPNCYPRKREKELVITPDSGSEMTAIGLDHFEAMGLNMTHLLEATPVNIRAANGSPLKSLGMFPSEMTYKGRKINTNVEVMFDFPNAVISWRDAKKLGILPPHYPEPCTQSSCCVMSAGTVTSPPPRSPPSPPRSPPSPPRSPPPPLVTRTPPVSSPTHSPPLPTARRKRKPPASLSPTDAREFFVREFPEVLRSHEDFDEGEIFPPMKDATMKINLKPDATPFAIHTPRNIPYALRDKTKKALDTMVAQGIIAPVPDDYVTTWVHPMVSVLKKNGEVRITTDLSHLNRQVIRNTHPFDSPKDVLRRVSPGAKFYSKMDNLSGYHQIPLDEASQHLTCFITPWGKYVYKRSPMGYIGSSDSFCRNGDKIIENVDNCGKVVDDILVWDHDYQAHIDRVFKILCKCSDNNSTMNKEKFIFAVPETDFCGNIVSESGIRADPEKVKAIQEFPVPNNITDLRSFFGLVNQLQDFSFEVSDAAEDLRPLLSTKNAFVWSRAHEESFNRVKKALTSPPVLAHYDVSLPTALQTDASRLNGLGYALLQRHQDKWRLVQCGSRFISKCESNYSTGEQEMLAGVWAVRKCRNYLLGLPHFELVMDHKPLIPILNVQTLDQVDNPRLQRLKEKLAGYNFTAVWRKGANHNIPDALSRAPVDQPDEEDRRLEEELNTFVRSIMHIKSTEITEFNDLILEDLRTAANADEEYKKLISTIISGFPKSKSRLANQLLPYWKIQHDLTHDNGLVIYKGRILVPSSQRREVLQHLHSSHRGVEATKRRASQTVWWPGIVNDIVTTTEACHACQTMQPSQPREPLMRDPAPTRPFESVSADLFSHAGKTYMVYADRYTGWCEVQDFTTDTTARSVIRAFRRLFGQLGVPMRLRTDGGPPFNSHKFKEFLKKWQVRHDLSTPFYPQSNGHSESNVKAMKHLVIKCNASGKLHDNDAFAEGVIELHNAPRADGLSSSMILLGRPLRSLVPTHHTSFDTRWSEVAKRLDKRTAAQEKADARYNRHAKSLPPLHMGAHVSLQSPTTKRWDTTGIVVGIGKRRDYLVRTPSGATYWRNRRFLRRIRPPDADEAAPADPPAPTAVSRQTGPPEDQAEPRRSKRSAKRPARYE